MSTSQTKIDKEWFNSRMQENGLSRGQVAKKMGLDPSALSRALNGQRGIKTDEIVKIAAILNEPVSAVVAHLYMRSDTEVSAIPTSKPHLGAGFMEAQLDFKDTSGGNEERIVAPRGADPLFGCMADTLTLLPDVDYTAPADPDWGRAYED